MLWLRLFSKVAPALAEASEYPTSARQSVAGASLRSAARPTAALVFFLFPVVLAASPARSQADPTFNGQFKVVECFVERVAECSGEFCTPRFAMAGNVSLDLVKRRWQSPPLNGPSGPLEIVDVSPGIIGQPLQVRFGMNIDKLGLMRGTLRAEPSNTGQYALSAALTSSGSQGRQLVWSGKCNIDVFAQ